MCLYPKNETSLRYQTVHPTISGGPVLESAELRRPYCARARSETRSPRCLVNRRIIVSVASVISGRVHSLRNACRCCRRSVHMLGARRLPPALANRQENKQGAKCDCRRAAPRDANDCDCRKSSIALRRGLCRVASLSGRRLHRVCRTITSRRSRTRTRCRQRNIP